MSPATPRGTDDEPGWLWTELALRPDPEER